MAMAPRRSCAAGGLALVLAAAFATAAVAQPIEAPDENRYTAWHDVPFTCSQLIAAEAGKDDSTDETVNYQAIMDWEAQFPKLRERRDMQSKAQLQASVLKWCNDAAANRTDPVLADVVEKVWRMMGY
jgi:hypothetical protein